MLYCEINPLEGHCCSAAQAWSHLTPILSNPSLIVGISRVCPNSPHSLYYLFLMALHNFYGLKNIIYMIMLPKFLINAPFLTTRHLFPPASHSFLKHQEASQTNISKASFFTFTYKPVSAPLSPNSSGCTTIHSDV